MLTSQILVDQINAFFYTHQKKIIQMTIGHQKKCKFWPIANYLLEKIIVNSGLL